MNYVGTGLVDPIFVRLAANLGVLCQMLAGGKNKETIHDYLNYQIIVDLFSARIARVVTSPL